MSFLENIKAGDIVGVSGNGVAVKREVARTTKTQIVVGTNKYRKSDGWLIGGSIWSTTHLVPWTEELEADYKARVALNKTRLLLNAVGLLDPTLLSDKHKDMLRTILSDATENEHKAKEVADD